MKRSSDIINGMQVIGQLRQPVPGVRRYFMEKGPSCSREVVQLVVTGFDRIRETVSRSARLLRMGGRPRSIRSMSSSTMSPILLKAMSSAPARWAERRKPGSLRTG